MVLVSISVSVELELLDKSVRSKRSHFLLNLIYGSMHEKHSHGDRVIGVTPIGNPYPIADNISPITLSSRFPHPHGIVKPSVYLLFYTQYSAAWRHFVKIRRKLYHH